MANPENLKKGIKTRFKAGEEQAKIAAAGGRASGEARRAKADLKRMVQTWLDNEAIKNDNGEPMTGAELMIAVAVKEMAKGNPRYWELLRDTAGQKPVDRVMISEVDQSIIDEVEEMVNG